MVHLHPCRRRARRASCALPAACPCRLNFRSAPRPRVILKPGGQWCLQACRRAVGPAGRGEVPSEPDNPALAEATIAAQHVTTSLTSLEAGAAVQPCQHSRPVHHSLTASPLTQRHFTAHPLISVRCSSRCMPKHTATGDASWWLPSHQPDDSTHAHQSTLCMGA